MVNKRLYILALVMVIGGSLTACGGKQRKTSGESRASDAPAAAATGDTSHLLEKGTDTNNADRGEGPQCGEAYEKDSETWFPGLPYAPLEEPLLTGGRTKSENVLFTDSRRDGLMAVLVEHSKKLPSEVKEKSRKLAMRIFGLDVKTNDGKANVQIDLLAEVEGQPHEKIQLSGRLGDGGQRRDLVQQKNGKAMNKPDYSGAMICADQDGGCKNIVVELHRLNSKGQKTRMVFMVYRTGEAHISMSEETRHDFKSFTNKEEKRMAEYLSNTAHNSCLYIVDSIESGARAMPDCAYQRLLDECGQSRGTKVPYARNFILRSWAVAFGRSAFDLTLTSGAQDRITIGGPLVTNIDGSSIGQELQVSGKSKYYANPTKVQLLANDGGGAMNLNIQFKGQPKAEMRINITSLLADTRYTADTAAALRN